MAKSYQDRGYGTTIDNYNAQKKKQAPISTLRAEQIQKQNQQKQNTSAPVSTVRTEQNYSTARSRADSAYRPHQVNTSKSTAAGKVTANEFARSTGLKNTYGSYANYLLDRPVTGGGYYTFGDAVSSRKMAHQAEQLGRYEDAVGLLRDNLDKAQKNAEDVFGGEVYPSIEEKAANLIYFMIKDHPFADGCKRIAASLFLEFLGRNNALFKNGKKVISDGALVAITLMIAESDPKEKDIMTALVMNLLQI